MSKCYNCETDFNLKEEEIKCDTCGEVVNYPCWNCKNWFSILDEETNTKIKECELCGFFVCPFCNTCGKDCIKEEWEKTIKEILNKELDNQWKLDKIINYIIEIKTSKEQKSCDKGVPISYAKSRIKSAVVRMLGYRTKDKEDILRFKERYDKIIDVPLGTILTVNQSREKGSYGQEFRDVFNYGICRGKLKKEKVSKYVDGEKIELDVYRRTEHGDCPNLDLKDLIIKVCPNPKCEIKNFPLSQEYCCDPRCNYRKGDKKGEARELKIKISNKNTCTLNRGSFKKDGER